MRFVICCGILWALLVLSYPSSGIVPDIHQGDVVYMGEHADISLALAWPDYTIAWCKPQNYDCSPPDQVIEITGYMHNYYIDPAVFHYGTYYRWSGEWSNAENAVAFTVMSGDRETSILELNSDTGEVVGAPAMITEKEGPYKWIIARNDDPLAHTNLNRTDSCYLWMFSNSVDILGKSLNRTNATPYMGQYTYQFSEAETRNLTAGTRSAYIQCTGKNEIQDVFMDGTTLETIYDDKIVPDIKVEAWNPYRVKDDFDTTVSKMSKFSDDFFIPLTIEVAEPSIFVSDIYTDDSNEKLYISGTTTWKNQTDIILKIDPDNYVLAQDIRLHTWTTTASGQIDSPRKFNTALTLRKDELGIGNHEIVAKADKNTDVGYFAYTFKVSDVYVMPTPTPRIERKIYTEEWSALARPQPAENISEPTPNETLVIGRPAYNYSASYGNMSYVIVDNETTDIAAINESAITVVDVSNATPVTTMMPKSTQTIPTIPLTPYIVFAAIGIAAMSLRRKK